MGFLKELRKSNFTGQYVPHLPGQPFLEVSDLTVRYEDVPALDSVSFQIHAGERIAVVGPNGAGKSTLFKVIAGILPPTSGRVQIAGYGPGGHICIAYVPQRSTVDWKFPVTVQDVVMMGRTSKLGLFRRPSDKDREIVRRCLDDVRMLDLAGRQISELSGGQQQRMFIARALAQEAELMLMDEPLNGLDVQSQAVIFDLLDDLRQRKITVMIATHDLDQAAERYDQVMLLNRHLVGFGRAEEIFSPANLLSVFGGNLRLVEDDQKQVIALASSCCDEGEPG